MKEPEIIPPKKDADCIRFKSIKRRYEEVLKLTPEKINEIYNVKYKKQAIAILERTEDHLHKLLIALDEIEVIDADFKIKE